MGILLVYDVTDDASFTNIRNWMRNIEQHASDSVNKARYVHTLSSLGLGPVAVSLQAVGGFPACAKVDTKVTNSTVQTFACRGFVPF